MKKWKDKNVKSNLLRELCTPEGIPLRLLLAGAGDRAAAFILDIIFVALILLGLTLFCIFVLSMKNLEMIRIIWLLGFFILRNFYFSFFEMGSRAATPGKRILGLRVVARNGGQLTSSAIIARNAMREIEIFLPLGFLFGGGAQIDGVISLLGLVWAGLFLFFPLFNRDRLRIGDFIAGTWVVHAAPKQLSHDISDTNQTDFDFSNEELGAYGIHELQVLENVLRQSNAKSIVMVTQRIRTKLNRVKTNDETDADFLRAYYAALRKTLEQKLLFGVRRKDKHDIK